MSQQPMYGSQQDPREPLKVAGDNTSPDPRVVENFHRRSDVDSRREAQHHTLGVGINQASPGNHNHDGTTSSQLLSGFTLTGTRGTDTAVGSIIQALVKLGATDNTSA